MTEPPLPPLPPLGPPRGTNFSRRNAMQPLPPAPASTWISTSSTNKGPRHQTRLVLLSILDRQDIDDPAVGAMIAELHFARHLREQGVVLAAADVEPRPEPPPALPDENRSARNDVAVM